MFEFLVEPIVSAAVTSLTGVAAFFLIKPIVDAFTARKLVVTELAYYKNVFANLKTCEPDEVSIARKKIRKLACE